MPNDQPWPARTRAWWRRWAKDPRSARFDAAAWDELLDCAVVHGRLWSGDVSVAGELRLRTAKFGTTPYDRARLRISLDDGLDAGKLDASKPAGTRARDRYAGLRVVPRAGSGEETS